MQIPQALPQFTNEKALFVVTAKERGVLYLVHEGTIEKLEAVAEHPPSHSDDEGFFFGGNTGIPAGGAPKETDDAHNFKQYLNVIVSELEAVIKERQPDRIYFFEPEHLHGAVAEAMTDSQHTPLETVATGNYVDDHPTTLLEHWQAVYENEPDPTDPASVENEANAEEKRKILETGQEL